MNKEIKFRAWNIPNKLMYQNVQDGILAENDKDQLILGVSLGKLSKDAGSILMQFTGLHDKNGKEIYEGDIDNKKRVCSYFPNLGSFGFKNTKYAPVTFLGQFIDRNQFVIGNIYENPELLDSSVVA